MRVIEIVSEEKTDKVQARKKYKAYQVQHCLLTTHHIQRTMLDKTYNSQHIEATWRERWENNAYFQPSAKGEAYCIMPPPM